MCVPDLESVQSLSVSVECAVGGLVIWRLRCCVAVRLCTHARDSHEHRFTQIWDQLQTCTSAEAGLSTVFPSPRTLTLQRTTLESSVSTNWSATALVRTSGGLSPTRRHKVWLCLTALA